MRYLFVNADDFGYCRSVNRGILRAHDEGIVTNCSLMVERPGAVEAVAEARRRPRLGVGLHAEIARWRVSRIPGRGAARSPATVRQRAEADLRRQVDRFRSLAGRDPTHLDSHQHRHRSELVTPVFEAVADELGIPLRHFDRRVRFSGAFYGHDGRGKPDPDAITVDALVALLEGLEDGATELCCHPGYVDDLDDWYRVEREQEVLTLCDPRVREAVRELDIRLCTFDEIGSLTEASS
jgi:chitin disaccharide deacetylase